MHRVVTIPLILVAAMAPPATAQDSASFVTRLGTDTLVVERFVRAPHRLEAEVVMRTPATNRVRYVLELSPSGDLTRLEAIRVSPARREVFTRIGDSLRVETTDTGPARVRTIAADRAVLPFLDMVHWPFELVLMRVKRSGQTQAAQPLLSGSRVASFPVAVLGGGNDSMTITHPTRGTMRVRVDAAGRLLSLDAGATTRKLVVQRVAWSAVDPDAVARAWSALDATGRSFGALSGRRVDTATVAGATIVVDHGTPAKRGRAIWGALVPFGQVWRTGANEATHFTTDRDLVLGSGAGTLAVPAGRYTLFSIPDASGGVLIVSRDTGQAGTAYNAARDLGRVPLETRALAELVEVFTLAVTPDGRGGAIRLQWDGSERIARFTVP